MGYRLHIRTVNKIEYGDGMFSSDTFEEFTRLIREHFGGDIWSDEEESTFEIPRGDFIDGIASVGAVPEEDFVRDFPKLTGQGYSRDGLVKALQTMYDTADPDNDEITFDWF